MQLRLYLIILLLANLFILIGCSKKEPLADPEVQPKQGPENIVDGIPDISDQTTETTTSLTMGIDLEKTVYDLKNEAKQMDVESLRIIAFKYKEAIEEKRDDWGVVMEQLAAISPNEKTGQKAEKLKAKMNTLADISQQLTQRFNVYLNELAAKNGDTNGLSL